MECQGDVGVIVGRFQVHDLHKAHRDLFDLVLASNRTVLVVLGESPIPNSRKNPLNFQMRAEMIAWEYPDVNVVPLPDRSDDDVWSKDLDELIINSVGPYRDVVLYGGRDSFLLRYSGDYASTELEQQPYSGTEVREHLSRKTIASSEFRAGAIWASQNRFPVCYPTVDVVCFTSDMSKVLLGRKPGESQFRVIGGFAEPTTPSYEFDAHREVEEEATLVLRESLHYVGSFLIDDWRYRGGPDAIKTLLFVGTIADGQTPIAADDIEEVKLFEVATVDLERDIMPLHRPLLRAALNVRATTAIQDPTVSKGQ